MLRFQPKETGESLRGLPGIEVASESTPGPCVRRDIRAARPVRVCGSRSLRRPSISSSPGSVAKLPKKSPNRSSQPIANNNKKDERKRTCSAASVKLESRRGTCRTPQLRRAHGEYRPCRPHAQRSRRPQPPRETRFAAAVCARRRR